MSDTDKETPEVERPDETEPEPGGGSPLPDREKDPEVPESDDDVLPQPTPGM
jgi:hypothetical protein